jgi:phosphatidylinositol phospholipase C delta
MHSCVGMVSRKFNIDDLAGLNYQPWDCVSVTEGKIESWAKYPESRAKVISYTRNSFMKVYPRGTRFDSSNCDPVKAWICGAQIGALNLQTTTDDYVLLNKIFFKQNRGLGYILKPNFLLDENAPVKLYERPKMGVVIKVISGIMLLNILKSEGVVQQIEKICVGLKIIGSFKDDTSEKFTDYIDQNFINPIFNKSFEFEIYEEDLSFLILQIYTGNTVLARSAIPLCFMEEGVRMVTLYDDACKEIENSMLVVRIYKVQH